MEKEIYNKSYTNPLEPLNDWDKHAVVADYIRQFGQEIVVICLKELAARQWRETSFLFNWHLYEAGALAYGEELFLNAFVTETRFYLYPELLKPLIANEEFAEKILGNLYKYGAEININAKDLKTQFEQAITEGFAFDRQLLPLLFEALLNPWKRDSLGFFAWWIQLMQPTRTELL